MSKDDEAAATAAILAALGGEPPRVVEKWFNRQSVYLDGYEFQRCRFDSCTLIVATGNFVLERCKLEDCLFLYAGNALRVAQLHSLPGTAFAAPTRHEDGTVSIPGKKAEGP